MLLELLFIGFEEKLETRESFSSSFPLLVNRLIFRLGDGEGFEKGFDVAGSPI